MYIQRVQEKSVLFFTIHCSATPPSPATLQKAFKAHSHWLVIYCTTNSSRVLARERWQTFENSLEKTQYLMNTLYQLINHKYEVKIQYVVKSLLKGAFERRPREP